jgi:hypothetical protein
MDIASIISEILNQAPYLMFAILGLGMVAIGSIGKVGHGQLDNRTKLNFIRVGWFIFWLFLVLAVLEIGWSGSLANFFHVIGQIVSSPLFWLTVGAMGLMLIGANRIRIQKIEQGYKIQTSPVVDKDNKEAYIQVENIGNGEFRCAARLTHVAKRDSLKSRKKELVDINEINPSGLFLGWKKGMASQMLHESIPEIVYLVDGEFRYHDGYGYGHYDHKVTFMFSNFEKSKEIDLGYYTLQVDFLRIKGKKFIKLSTFEEIIKVTNKGLEWVKR